jgi:nuclear transport factor 2 (NTF2) superfamily protein
MRRRDASINDYPIEPAERRIAVDASGAGEGST